MWCDPGRRVDACMTVARQGASLRATVYEHALLDGRDLPTVASVKLARGSSLVTRGRVRASMDASTRTDPSAGRAQCCAGGSRAMRTAVGRMVLPCSAAASSPNPMGAYATDPDPSAWPVLPRANSRDGLAERHASGRCPTNLRELQPWLSPKRSNDANIFGRVRALPRTDTRAQSARTAALVASHTCMSRPTNSVGTDP